MRTTYDGLVGCNIGCNIIYSSGYNIGWVAVWEVANPLIIGVAAGEILLELEGDMGCRYLTSILA